MIVVVGAGLIGLAIAFEVARRGGEVRVVDAHEPAAAASWAGAGMLAPYTESLASPAFEALCADSLARYPRFVADVRDAGGIDARLHLDGIVDAAFDAAAVQRGQARVAALSARGIAARWLDREAALLLEPALGSHVLGAVHSLTEGHVDNRRLGRALRAACAALGVRVDANAGDIVLEADERRVLGVRGPFGFVPARAVVNAAGAWAGALAGVPDRARAAGLPRQRPNARDRDPAEVRAPRRLDSRKRIRRASLSRAARRWSFARRRHRGKRPRRHARDRARSPGALGGRTRRNALPSEIVAVAETWAGVRPGSPDGMPYLGETSLTGYFTATGHYRNGILLAPATAHVMADVLEGKPGDALAPFAPGRASGEAMLAR